MSHYSSQRDSDEPLEILVVEDNPGDVRLLEEALDSTVTETTVETVTDGDDAVEYLRQSVADEDASPPDLAIVDLKLPGRDGCAVLDAIRDDPQLCPLPAIVLTSSDDSEDVERCYDSQANAYLTKPTSHDEFVSLVEHLEEFWFERARLPPVPP